MKTFSMKVKLVLPLFFIFVQSFPLFASRIDLVREPVYVRRGFDPSWVNAVPAPGDKNCLVFPGSALGARKIVLNELPFEGMPRRSSFSLREYPPEDFTFSTSFALGAKDLEGPLLKAVYFANIGENWAVYLNGHLLKDEIHLDQNGRITAYRHHREVLIPIDPRFFREGTNILTVRITGDPTNIDSGFHRSTPFVIDDLETLRAHKSEQTELILIFIYLFVGIYHLFLFLRRTTEKYNFYYSAFSVMLFVYLVSRTSAVYAVIPDSTVLHRLEYCTLYALIPLFGAFSDLLIEGRFGVVTKVFSSLCALLILVTVLPVSNPFAIDVLRIWQVTSIVPLVYIVFYRIGRPVAAGLARLFSDYHAAPPPARIGRSVYGALFLTTPGNMLIGALVMFGCAVFDILDSMFWAYDLVLAQYGFFAFTIGITLILADRFISIHKTLEQNCEVSRIEMELASDVHSQLLPPAPAGVAGWDIALAFKPRHGASGDFYDFYIRDNRLEGLAIFDVSGHGVSSALITMIIKPIVYRLFTGMRDRGLDEIIKRLEEHLSVEIARLDNFASCILLRFREGSIEYANAAHPGLLHLHRDSGMVETAGEERGDFRFAPIGQQISQKTPEVINLDAKQGDVLLLFTDCIIESANTRKGTYGTSRLMAALAETRDMPAGLVLDHILRDFHAFMAGEQILDDFTVICLRKTGE